ncbi:NADH dehydrogenase [ubiquinone] 1 alpha subcomplex assembly factor 3 [Aplysia californica]|uniref:NADH dehydrogenase [ubiquinone] 1 alpha subcomplex assembly factor 3 n=1 Tax=Aplysia californica TaxID=6500 RepID=A0ABM0JEM6_APLCA|nr:NADH dehydrogenase [ubiquinone] 1 alpha subcomplex assembly factor 3 [Aplysia californica]
MPQNCYFPSVIHFTFVTTQSTMSPTGLFAPSLCRTFSGLLSRRIVLQTSTSVRHHNFDGEAYSKTNISLMTKEDETHTYVEAFSPYGFRLTSGFRVLGPCALFPRAVLHWNVSSADKITPESLSLFCLLEPKPDILIIGKGDWDATVNKEIIRYLRSKKINVEILPTEQACSTFNFLNSERRVVAAGLIPPLQMADQEDFTLDTDTGMSLLDGSTESLEDPQTRKTMEMFKEKGIMDTFVESERQRKRSSGRHRPWEQTNEDSEKK